MAAVDQNLFRELKGKYPELPDDLVTSCIARFGNDREKCMETLAQESTKVLFDESAGGVNEHMRGINDMKISDQRPRSDSTGSNRSNASTGSGSVSRPPFHASHSLINVPGYRGPINVPPDENTPLTAPVNPSAINQFIDFYGNEQNPQTIPNINCNNSTKRAFEGASYNVNYGHNLAHMGNSSPNLSQNQKPVLRQLEVQHIQTSKDHMESNNMNYSQPANYMYQITIDRSPGAAGHTMPGNPGHAVNSNHNTWSRQSNVQQGYQNVTFPNSSSAAFSDIRSNQYPSYNNQPFTSPSEEHRGIGHPMYNQQGSQHSSQATIILSKPVSNPGPHFTPPPPPRPNPSPLHGQYNYSPSGDQGMSPNYIRTSQSYGHFQPGANAQSSPKTLGRPIVVEIKSSGRENTGVQSQIQYFNNISNTGLPGEAGQRTLQKSPVISHPSQPPDNTYVPDRLYRQERPTVINIPGHSTSQDEREFLQFPPMPNVCCVPGHPTGPLHSASTDSDSAFGAELDYRQVAARPFVSPASSQSSHSSESSPAMRERPRSGSIQEDPEYTQALLSHQQSGMKRLVEDVGLAEARLNTLQQEVNTLECAVIERKKKRTSNFPSSVDLAKLRGENLQLQADIQLMTREIDLFNNGQTPLGVLDPNEQQNFYKNMNTGQRGSIYASTTQVPPRTHSSTVTSIVTTSTVTTPTRPPPDIPPSLPPRERNTAPPPLPPRSATPATPAHVPPPPPHQPTVVSGDSDTDGEQWSCSACTFLNHPALNKCECCEMPRSSSVPGSAGSSSGAAAAAAGAFSSPLSSNLGDVPDTYPSPGQTPQTT